MMNAEDKLFKKVDGLMLHDSLKKNEVLTVWERTFLSSAYSIYRRTSGNEFSTKGLSPKQKSTVFSILKKYNYHLMD
ncbi:hypothetical protein NFL00_24115 (plasmid) [Escherichia coli]|uniref:hypothetical protein n=1 Tax=Salmonella enterica TaxID=28901 RepID=UPI00279D9883|nr:hypothetical protein NFL00_24115 [Escherichia coli]